MPTTKKRLNLSLPESVEITIVHLAKWDGVPVATKALELLREALELHEDMYFDRVATERLKKKGKLISHEEVWK